MIKTRLKGFSFKLAKNERKKSRKGEKRKEKGWVGGGKPDNGLGIPGMFLYFQPYRHEIVDIFCG